MCNMLGAMLTNQQPIQKIIGVYYIFQDLVLWAQYGYYTKIYPLKQRNRSETFFKLLSFDNYRFNNCSSLPCSRLIWFPLSSNS